MANGISTPPNATLEEQMFRVLNHAYRCQQIVASYEALSPERKSEFDTQMGVDFMASLRLNSVTTLDMRIDPTTGTVDYLVKIGFAVNVEDGKIKLTDYNPNAPLDKLYQSLTEFF